jgi:ABC-type lipoprotein export system ATPase subunit
MHPSSIVLSASKERRFIKTHKKQNPLVEIREVVKIYRTGDGFFTALDGIALEVFEGEFLGIIGKSGAGKTTLLNMISGISKLTSGEVLFYNPEHGDQSQQNEPICIHAMGEDAKAAWRGRNLGIVYQSFELMPSLTLVENVMLPQDFCGVYDPVTSKERALELLELVEIGEHAYKIPAHISGGQKQRVAIARALVNDPPLIIADEPTGNLDSVTAGTILRIFEKLVDRGKTVIMVTHDQSLADRFSRQLSIVDGKLMGQSSRDLHFESQKEKTGPVRIISSSNPFGNNLASGLSTYPDENGKRVPGSDGNSPAISLQNVVKTYENAAGKFTALKGIDLQFDYGQFVSIVGKSGCGKSTLLNMITGIDHPTSGNVIVRGEDVYKMSESQRALWRGRNVGVIFQFFQLLPTLTLLENTMLPMDYCNMYAFRERPERAMELLSRVGLEHQAHMLPSNVSSGQQQSAAIARALANDPSIILADEPTGNLDSRAAEDVLDLFGELAAQGKTVLIVTHDSSLTKRTDQTVILSDGEVIDQTVVRALPFLDHPQMLAATHKAVKQVYPPGSMVIHQGQPVDHFFMVAKGEVEVVVNSKIPETRVARLGPGQFFGEVSLTMGLNSIAGVRTMAGEPTELALISKAEFLSLLNTSPRMTNALESVAKIRMNETRVLLENAGRHGI